MTEYAPASDDVFEYVAKHPLHNPLGFFLFFGVPLSGNAAAKKQLRIRHIKDTTRNCQTCECVTWSGNQFLAEPRIGVSFDVIEDKLPLIQSSSTDYSKLTISCLQFILRQRHQTITGTKAV